MNRVYCQPATTQQRLSACVASILELEAGAVPSWEKVEPADLVVSVADFVKGRGLAYVEFALGPNHDLWQLLAPLGFWIFRGPSARGDFVDSVVCHGDKLVHDPGNQGTPFAVDELNAIFDGTEPKGWTMGLFIPFNPMHVRRHERAKAV